MITAIIFDCFGVLTQDGWSVFLQKYATEETLDELRYLNAQVDKGFISSDAFFDSICNITGALKADALKIMVQSYHPEDSVFDLIKKLKLSYKIGLISNISAPIEKYIPGVPTELFDVQTLSYQVGYAKPSPEIFNVHLKEMGIMPQDAVFIDDRESNCEGARAVGMQAIAYQNIEQLKEELKLLNIHIEHKK